MRVLYLSSKRAEERVLLEYSPSIEFKEIQYRFKKDFFCGIIKKIISTLNIIEQFKPDCILLESSGIFSLIAVYIKIWKKVPIAVRMKGDYYREYNEIKMDIPIYYKIKKILIYNAGKLTLKKADLILPISEKIKLSMNSNFKTEAKYNVVNIPLNNIERINKRAETSECPYIISITNFNFWGKVIPLIEAVENMGDLLSEHDMTWYILGDGYFFQRFKNRLDNCNNKGNIKLEGHRDPSPYLMGGMANFYISGMDGLPNVLIESYNYGIPVVMNHDCPAVEFIKGGKTGKIIDFSDAHIVEETIKSLINDYSEWEKIGSSGREFAQREFSIEKVSTDLYNALKSIT